MKKIKLLSALLLFALTLVQTSCNNEPLEGDFITDDGSGTEASFLAKVNGVPFEAATIIAQLNNGVLVITATNAAGDTLLLTATNLGECTYDLSLSSNPAQYFVAGDENIYVTLGVLGGSGSMTVETYLPDVLTVSGTFNFTGARLVNSGGGSTTQLVNVTEGVFTALPVELVNGDATPRDCSTTNGGDDGQMDAEDSFFALVDGEEFIDTTFEAEEILVGGEPVIKITATNDTEATIQFFVPKDLTIGTYELESIFNGPTLIGIYNKGDGSNNQTSSPGTITFTEFGAITGKISANFSFSAVDPVNGGEPTEITEGAFNIDYIENSTSPGNEFSATIDGEEYLPTLIEFQQSPFNGFTRINVTTQNTDTNQSLTLSFDIPLEAGVYEMSPLLETGEEKIGILNPDIGNSLLFRSNPGLLTIVSYEISSGVVEALFEFTAVDPLGNNPNQFEVSNGRFLITLP